jgi:hypothetical protein
MIVNPSKKKFEDTVLNETHYDLLRIYNNELEKENSVLFVMGRIDDVFFPVSILTFAA